MRLALSLITLFLLGCSTNPGGTAISEALDSVSKAVPRFSFFSREQVVIYYYECKKNQDKEQEDEKATNSNDDGKLLEGDTTESVQETTGRL